MKQTGVELSQGQSEPIDKSRRSFFNMSVLAAGAMAGSSAIAQTFQAVCGLTPPQTEGPFYPVKDQPDEDNDLTQVNGHTQKALGKLVFIIGQVTDQNCAPLPNALVEIWQACASGRYNHPNDTNPAPLDPNFQYWGKCVTDAQGHYRFKTILPGAYPADTNWMRPPHIHFKVHKLGFHELTTQMYFAGNKFNAADKILQALSPPEQAKVVVPLEPPPTGVDPNSRICKFDLSLVHA